MTELCLASSTRPRRRNLLAALAQYTVSHFRSSSTKSSSWFLSSLMTMNRGRQGSIEKKFSFFMKRKDDILLSRKQILTVCLRSEIFPQQNSNFQGENCPQIYNFWLKLPF